MDVQEQFVRDKEIDPNLYYPEDVKRELIRVFPNGFKIKIPQMIGKKIGDRIKSRSGGGDD
jgi:ribonuclease Z